MRERLLAQLRHSASPLTRTTLRARLQVNNQRLGEALSELARGGLIVRTPKGWITSSAQTTPPSTPGAEDTPEQSQCTLPL